jgi:hypothetical protein
MTEWIPLLAVAALIAIGSLLYRSRTLQLLERYGTEFKTYNDAAFRQIVEESPDANFQFVTRLASEVQSKRGQRAILMPCLDRGTAVQHINQDGTFSAKGPYFVSLQSGRWKLTGSRHLVKVIRGTRSGGFKPDHYKQSGFILEKGVAILEYGTNRYPPVKIREFVKLHRSLRSADSQKQERVL